jgi:pentatricopeptide repeat protein
MDAQGIAPNVVIYGSILDSLVKTASGSTEILLLIEKMQAQHIPFNEHIYCTLIDHFGKQGDTAAMISWYHKMQAANIPPNPHVLCSIIDSFGRAHQLNAMLEWFERLTAATASDRVQPNTACLNALLSNFADHNKSKELFEWYARFPQYQLLPDNLTFSIIFSYLRRMNASSRDLLQWVQRIPANGVITTDITLFYIFDALQHTGDLNAIKQVLAELPLFRLPSPVLFSIITTFQQQQQLPQLRAWMQERAAFYSATTLNTFDFLADVFSQEEVQFPLSWPQNILAAVRNIKLFESIFNTLVKKRNSKVLLAWLKELYNVGLTPNVHIFGTIFSVLSKERDVAKMSELLKEMEGLSLQPDQWIYDSIIQAHTALEQVDEAVNWFNQFRSYLSKSKPPQKVWISITYTSVIATYAKNGKFDKMLELFSEMKAMGYAPTVATYTAIIYGYGKHGMLDLMLKYFNEMKDTDCKPNTTTYNNILHSFGKVGNFEQMKKENIPVNADTYNAFMYAYGNTNNTTEMLSWYEAMKQSGIAANADTFETIIGIYARLKNLTEVMNWFENMQKSGFDTSTVKPLITATFEETGFTQASNFISNMSQALPQ